MAESTATGAVTATAGSLRLDDGVRLPHPWTDEGIVADAQGTGAHLLHLAVAVCVLNDVYREARRLDVPLDGVAVHAWGGFTGDWSSTGVGYRVILDGPSPSATAALLAVVDEVAEIPHALRAGAAVTREES